MFNQSGSRWANIPPVTKNLLLVNFMIWIVELVVPSFSSTINRMLGLHFVYSDLFNPIQIVTYMFVHSTQSIFHIFFNMFSLWMFGRILEQVWGSRRFFVYYMICGMGAAIVQETVWALTWHHEFVSVLAKGNLMTYDSMEQIVNMAVANSDSDVINAISMFHNKFVTIGASGAVFGLLLGFAFVFPNMPLYLFFIPVPIKAKYMVLGYAVLEFFFGVGGKVDTVAHFAHLGGMLFGIILLLYWKKKGTLNGNRFY